MLRDARSMRWKMLALVAGAELLGMSLWFAANAAAPQLQERWNLEPGRIGWLTGAVQIGFVAGTAAAALLNLADVWPSRFYFAGAASLAALANFVLPWAPGFGGALVTRFLTGFFLAGVYPPGMKMVATWFEHGRGLAIGIVVGALGIGKAIPYLVHAFGRPSLEFIATTTAGGAILAAAAIAGFYRDGPYPFARRAFEWQLVADVLRHRETRLAIGAYLGHMWELYAMWTWMPAFIAASLAARSTESFPPWLTDAAAFGTLVAGGLGCVWGGWASLRIGYARVARIALYASGACCLLAGAWFGAPLPLLLAAMVVWGFFVVADSAQFSALVADAAPRHAVGTALTLQTSLGFLLTTVTIQLVPVLVAAAGWRWAFAVLAVGPVLGIAALARLPRTASPHRST